MRFPLPRRDHAVSDHIAEMAHLLDLDHGPWVAGGAVRRIIAQDYRDDFDIDVFFASEEQRAHLLPEFERMREGWKEKSLHLVPAMSPSLQAINLRFAAQSAVPTRDMTNPLVQLSDRFFPDLDSLLHDFDFTIVKFATDGKTVVCPHRAINDLHERRLIMDNETAIKNQGRLLRYFSYGFEPGEGVVDRITIQGDDRVFYQNNLRASQPMVDRCLDIDYADYPILGKVARFLLVRCEGEAIVFLDGFPFPVMLGFIYLTSDRTRYAIEVMMRPIWDRLGLGPRPEPTSPSLKVSTPRFFEAYKEAYSLMTSTTPLSPTT